VLVVIFVIYALLMDRVYKCLKKDSEGEEIKINKHALPLIKDDSKYIELQTKEWIKRRNKGDPCYAVIEKDKIVMTKWIEMFGVKSPRIIFYAYHDQFKRSDLDQVACDKKLVLKISHLQSSYGIIIIPANPSKKELDEIYEKCQERFGTCFVCNHDRSDPPTNKEINDGKKKTYYELYQTIKPGVVIQDFFYSTDKKNGNPVPREIKILLVGNRILNLGIKPYTYLEYIRNPKKYELLINEAKRIRSLIGATFIRVDFFIKEDEEQYTPYLNEISLSPNGGMRRAFFNSSSEIEKFKREVEKSEIGEYNELDKLIDECPCRETGITRYMTDAECTKEKY